ncbi:MATE family efflux transporter [Anaerobranca gottschalkii]|uniref:Probable multidrug resistance protein NorM n=1 Tax=Anaerobranca gottschalkii DSM 13577 TaxID=1120990 RepID=A0A1I0CEY8_9FIRM|nr:MATE family efflux transporter [Anaerobranca gottschalkii]SET18138.1 putative efflux protein, MATE family [Anaerobranca gottschalkii DSM 13577]
MGKTLTYSNKREFILNNENLYHNALYLATPIVLQSLLQVSIGTVDMKMVGTLGADAIAAIGAGKNIVMLIMVLVMAISTGTTALVARFIGQGDRDKASLSAGQSFFLCLAASLFMIPLGLLINRPSLQLLGVSDNVLALAEVYMLIFFITIPLFLLNFIARAIFQGSGDTQTPLLIDIVMNLSNVLFNYLLIFGIGFFPPLGVMGAALGTAISRLIGALLGWSALVSGKFMLKVKIKDMLYPHFTIIKQVVKIGLPAALQGVCRNASTFFIFAILARTAAQNAAITAFTIGTNLSQYAIMPGLAVGTAAATLSGMNIGAKKLKRAEESGKACVFIGAGFMIFFALIFVTFAEPLINFFLDKPNDEIVKIGKTFLYILALSEPFHAMTIIFSRTMQGAGYTKYPFLITLVCWVVIRVSLAYLLAFPLNLQETGVWIAITTSTVISGLLSYYLFRLGKWKYVKINQPKR